MGAVGSPPPPPPPLRSLGEGDLNFCLDMLAICNALNPPAIIDAGILKPTGACAYALKTAL